MKKRLMWLAAAALVAASSAWAAIPPDVPANYFVPGDINGNGSANGIDVTYGVTYLKGGAAPPHIFDCTGATGLYAEADANGNCAFNGIDITYYVAYLKGIQPALLLCQGCLRDSVQVNDASILPGQSVTWHSDTTYILNGFVFVDDGATLTIEPGCVVKGHPGQAENASALLVARGGMIIADGTVDAPIVFTCSSDFSDDIGYVPFDLAGQWGGLIVLGNATNNYATGEGHIEGIPETEERGTFGGSDDNDNSGIIRYVSIRHGGSIIGANNEINGLTMGSVGRGTTIDYVEVFSNLDDGYEWFGGAVECRHILSVWNDDDNFDYDTGWHGKGQFWFAFQDSLDGNRGGEHDGGISPQEAEPWSNPYIANETFIGSGMNSANNNNDWAFFIDDYAGGHFWGGIFTEFRKRGISIDDLPDPTPDARDQLERDSLEWDYTVWSKFGYASLGQPDSLWPQTFVRDYMTNAAQNTTIMTTGVLTSVSWTPGSHGLNPRPVGLSTIPAPHGGGDAWFVPTNYYGAFDPNAATPLWTNGWTYLSRLGFTQ